MNTSLVGSVRKEYAGTCPATRDCITQCERVCLDDRLRPYVEVCCNCDPVCNLDTLAKSTAMLILAFCLL